MAEFRPKACMGLMYLWYASCFFQSSTSGIRCEDLEFVKEIFTPFSKIGLLSTNDQELFLLKQRKDCSVHGQVMTVLEAWGASIAQKIGLRANRVQLIPASEKCSFKFFDEYPATLHTFVPGVVIAKALEGLSITLKSPGAGGLSLALIKNMAFHKDLPKIVAFDTFIGCSRHHKNLLYDEKSDRFYVVDFGSALRISFAQKSIENEILFRNLGSLKKREIKALTSYYKTLKKLLLQNTLESLLEKLDRLIRKAGLSSKSYFCKAKDKSFTGYIEACKGRLRENYYATHVLVKMLEPFVKNESTELQQAATHDF